MSERGKETIVPEPTALLRVPIPFSTDVEPRESVAQFRELMAHLKQVFWIKNAEDTAVLYVSPAYEKIWGRSRPSLYDNSQTFMDSIHPDDRERMSKVMIRKHKTEGYEEEYRVLRPDGTMRWIWARTYPVRDEAGRIKRYAGIAEDVSERKWAEKERRRLAAIIEHSEDAIVSITLEGIIIAWNAGAERKYGYTAGEIIGRSIFILIPPDQCQKHLDIMERVKNGDHVPSYDTVRLRKDGTIISFSIGISPIEARDGTVVGVSKIAHDISRVRKLEADLIEAQKMEVIGQLTGGVAHDFNNILAVIMGYSEMMMHEFGPDHRLSKAAATILHAAVRGAGLTRQLLVFSRKESAQSAVVDLNDVLGKMDGMLRQLINQDIDLTVTQGARLGRIMADPGHVGQLLMNLVVNARDAMPGGGTLFIATSDVTLDARYAAAHPGVEGGEYVRLCVGDTGTGMTDEVKAHLFEAFFTTKPKGRGTGLGLATCRTIVKQAGGHIDLRSEAGKGTTFEIYFPRIGQQIEFAADLPPPGPLPRGKETLLVVEEDPDVRQLVRDALQAQGYRVLLAANGQDGLRALRNNQNTESAIRLLVTDVVIPQIAAGWPEAGNHELKVIFTSGSAHDEIVEHGLLESGASLLPKPYSIAMLVRKVRELLDSPPLQRLQKAQTAAAPL